MHKKICFTLSMAAFIFSAAVSMAASENEQFDKAKDLSINRQWDSAIEAFDRFISDYPQSALQDDALFWTAYCLEKKGDNLIEAYMAFEQLIRDFPTSVWADDARMHQIGLAETMVRRGNEDFSVFLNEMLEAEDVNYRQQAAMALGRLGDAKALPVLESMQNNPTFANLVQPIIDALRTSEPSATIKQEQPGYIGLGVEQSIEKPKKVKKERSFLFFKTTRYKQYRAMLRDDDSWTEEELVLFGMWEILDTDLFKELSALDGFDRQEWLRKYWKSQDPTPTTDTNEAYDEFISRVHKAKAEYGERWNARHLRFLRDQFIRDGWLHAPWDARGELYIKYGEPDFISPHGFQQQLWEYNRYKVDFIVSQYMTNIYGQAIFPGPLSDEVHKQAPYYVEHNFIFKKEFKFGMDYGTHDFIENLKIDSDKPFNVVNHEIVIPYSIPAKEFKMIDKNGQSAIEYQEDVVIFNTDWQPVWQTHHFRQLVQANKKDWKKNKEIRMEIKLPLSPGDYLMAIRLKDAHRDDIGIFKMDFRVK